MSHFAINYYTQAGNRRISNSRSSLFQIVYVRKNEKKKKNCKWIKTIYEKNKTKKKYLTLIQTNRIAHMGRNVTIWI